MNRRIGIRVLVVVAVGCAFVFFLYPSPDRHPVGEPPTSVAPADRPPASTPPATVPPADRPACVGSCAAMPRGDLPGWSQVFADDFLTDVPVGAFPGTVYGDDWGAYRDGWPDTTDNGTYMPSKVLSVHDGVLDMFIHTENGVHLVSAPTPKVPAGRYGRYSVRFRADPLHGYRTAWLLWPDNEELPDDSEIDWPEGNLDETMFARMHYVHPTDAQSKFHTSATFTDWHIATTIWTPRRVTFELDGRVIGSSSTQVPHKPMHWVLQTETSTDTGVVPDDATAGHVLVDWVVAYKMQPKPAPSPPVLASSALNRRADPRLGHAY